MLEQTPQPPPRAANWPFYNNPDIRTVIAWSNRNDFFLITSASNQTWSSMAAWLVSPTGFFATNKELTSLYAAPDFPVNSRLRMQGAVMLDGGGSSEFGYLSTIKIPSVSDDGTEISSHDRYLPTFVGASYP